MSSKKVFKDFRTSIYKASVLNIFPRDLRLYHTRSIGSGPHGVDRRTPSFRSDLKNIEENSIAITDPFLLYQNYVQQGLLEKDESQLRVMKEFQKLYHRVIDYSPPEELLIKISLLLRKIELKHAEAAIRELGRNVPQLNLRSIQNIFRKDPEAEKRQLVRTMTDEEELYNFESPQGLLVNGEVGCGKSMLMDIFAASLPHKSKMRWHYNNFILWVFNEMHKIRNERHLTSVMSNNKAERKMSMENEFVLFEIAQKMIDKNTILMLDEFMLPDIASANIIKILFTYYFKLGGVLVATSNKLPEDLYSNDFHKTKFKSFVGILHARCQSVDMRSSKDYRSEFSNLSTDLYLIDKLLNENHERDWLKLVKVKALGIPEESIKVTDNSPLNTLGGTPSTLTVYSRTTHIPMTFKSDTVCYLDFSYICQGLFSSSDYITLASRYRTIILDNVPMMTLKMKNEARRFITLLDAMYEAKCQLFMRSDVEVDYLFFPDQIEGKLPDHIQRQSDLNNNRLDVQDEEMFARTTIDMMNPYRPNVSSYDQKHTSAHTEHTNGLFGSGNDDPDSKHGNPVNFKNLKAFTGEDEKFAYKRAVLRIKEMVGSETWKNSSRWVPIDESMRPWEKKSYSIYDTASRGSNLDIGTVDIKIDKLIKDNRSVRQIANKMLVDTLPKDFSEGHDIPFRQFNARIAPVFDRLTHFWSMGSWSSKQGKRLKDKIAKSWIRSSMRNNE
ncbi:uncharacterized protein AC631_02315 [Debaryomyces fabryi]|uniref:Lactation elevated protein 1 n=1 Tax=Debaryomyces fabryi TaxID=58627 RepID=A0A0V1Q0C0_9ASCO|nr:uncharacterized protein AC631_02315 [Debaryomyces fabryi]KSA01943.1 hypothetical protein AC631_02315 [Debaryomyces fabryi]CUM48494.1 unnamed protein product [Debaryomyces fabryi]